MNLAIPINVSGQTLTGRAGIEWGISGVPETFIVGAGGVVLYRYVGPVVGDEAVGYVPRRPQCRGRAIEWVPDHEALFGQYVTLGVFLAAPVHAVEPDEILADRVLEDRATGHFEGFALRRLPEPGHRQLQRRGGA